MITKFGLRIPKLVVPAQFVATFVLSISAGCFFNSLAKALACFL
jgi:hypothetical protein